MNTANRITVLRMLLVPLFMVVALMRFKGSDYAAFGIFVFASATDFLDGYIARHYNQVTDFGKFMDPLADKLLVTAAILIFVERGQMSSWGAMIIIAREFAVTGLRLIAASDGRVIAAAWSGKLKTSSSIIAICIMLLPMHALPVWPGVFSLNDVCSIVMVTTTLWSGIEYFIKNADVLRPNH
jgi:CDP-diacylglycerol--glycerol-3-phosphate 3-phosphatidyltransferase